MNVILKPCQCECEKEIIKTQMIVIMKKHSPQKNSQTISIDHAKIPTVAMELKHMKINRNKLSMQKRCSNLNNWEFELFIENKESMKDTTNHPSQKNLEHIIQNSVNLEKIKYVNINKQIHIDTKQQNKKMIEQKISHLSSEQQTQRKTMKKYNNYNSLKNKKLLRNDIQLTTKRYKNKNNSTLQSPNESKNIRLKIDQVILIQSEKQNIPTASTQNKDKNKLKNIEQASEITIKLMNQQIQILKNQLKRLQADQLRLMTEKNQNQKLFAEDYVINEKIKENLKLNCDERYEELKDLKKLLSICKSRSI